MNGSPILRDGRSGAPRGWLSGALTLIAPALRATSPGRGWRGSVGRIRFLVRCARAIRQIGALASRSAPEHLARTLRERPELIGIAQWPYINRFWTPTERFRALQAHYAELERMPALQIGVSEQLLVSDLNDIVPGLSVVIDRPSWFMREGELTINLFKGGFRAYSLSFSFGRVDGQRVLHVGCLQGRHADGVDLLYRELTHKLHGWRPRDVMVSVVQMVATASGATRVLLVSEEARVHRHRYFAAHHDDFVSANYDEIWIEHGAVLRDDGFFELRTRLHRRLASDMPSHKRAMYRRRYALMTRLGRDVRAVVSAPDQAAAVPAATQPHRSEA